MRKEQFQQWLRNNGVVATSNEYSRAIDKLSEHYSQHKEPVDIYQIDDVQTLEPIRALYQRGGEFGEYGNKHSGLYRAAINKYLKFVYAVGNHANESEGRAPDKEQILTDTNNFSYERDLQTSLCDRIDKLFPDYTLLGREYNIGKKRIDVLLQNKNDESLLVIELKAEVAGKEALGQTAEYMGLLSESEKYAGKTIKGCIIANEIGDDLQCAMRFMGTDKISLQTYEMKLQLSKVDITKNNKGD